jgi:hypothetical protein
LFTYKWIKGGLKESVVQTFEKRQRRKTYEQALPDDIDAIKSELARLREHTGLAEDEEEIVEAEVAEAEAEVDLEK